MSSHEIMRRSIVLTCVLYLLSSFSLFAQTAKPKLTLDEFFNSVGFTAVKVSPDGDSVVVATERADWEQQIFRKDLWLYRIAGQGGSLVQLTQSGHDSHPRWSPDGQWIAFLSERKPASGKDGDAGDDKEKEIAQLFLISPQGGEAFAITSGDDDVHAFAWSADSKAIYFATRQPWTKQQNDDHKKDWKDVVRFRGDERGDVIFRIRLDDALARHAALGAKELPDAEKDSGATPGAEAIARTPLRADQLAISRDGSRLALVSSSVSERQEKVEEIELYLVNLASASLEVAPTRLTRNQAVEVNLEWALDNRHLFFQTNLGSVEGKYEDPQPRLYWVDSGTGEVQRWFADYGGEVVQYTPMPDGSVLCACRLGTEVQIHSQASPKAASVKRDGWAGRYELPASSVEVAAHRVRAFHDRATDGSVYCGRPRQVERGSAHHFVQPALHPARPAQGQALSLEVLRRHAGGGDADVSAGQV